MDRFYRLIYEQTHYIEEKKDRENDNGDRQMWFPILCIFLYLDYERVLSVNSIKLVTKRLNIIEFQEGWCT